DRGGGEQRRRRRLRGDGDDDQPFLPATTGGRSWVVHPVTVAARRCRAAARDGAGDHRRTGTVKEPTIVARARTRGRCRRAAAGEEREAMTSTTAAPTLEVRALSKRYGARAAVDALSFSCTPGTVTGFLGPNGAGKSTTLRILTGLAVADEGMALIG